MTSDVQDPITFYADLPSIFDNNSSCSTKPLHKANAIHTNTKESYQPIFGSFRFVESDPLNKAAFVASSLPSIEVERTEQEQLMDYCASGKENNTSSCFQATLSSPLSSIRAENVEDDYDEDDFDGIPIRHSSMMMTKNLHGDSDLTLNHSKYDDSLDNLDHNIENLCDDYTIDDVDSLLNGFTDDEPRKAAITTTTTAPSLIKDILDIDDPNEPEEDHDNRIPFDYLDMFDQSESIRSSSPDSLLSSSQLQDGQENDIIFDDEVAQWNDNDILNMNSSIRHSQINSSLVLKMNSFDQVDFIDSSHSHSRCSNFSSHLSIGYTDQAHTFISDDEFIISSDSEENDNNNDDDDMINLVNNTLSRNDDDDDDLRLQVDLDDHRSFSSFSKSNSGTRSSSLSSDESPIVDIDQDNDKIKTFQTTPIPAPDTGDDVGNEASLKTFISNQLLLPFQPSNIKNQIKLLAEKRKNEIVHDIINIRHLFDENDHNDEFIAVIHNPRIFEQVLHNCHNEEKVIDFINLRLSKAFVLLLIVVVFANVIRLISIFLSINLLFLR